MFFPVFVRAMLIAFFSLLPTPVPPAALQVGQHLGGGRIHEMSGKTETTSLKSSGGQQGGGEGQEQEEQGEQGEERST